MHIYYSGIHSHSAYKLAINIFANIPARLSSTGRIATPYYSHEMCMEQDAKIQQNMLIFIYFFKMIHSLCTY